MAEVKTDTVDLPHKDEDAFEGRLETMIYMKIGEVKGISNGPGGKIRDIYVNVMLDQEELYRTATIEKTINPLISEQFSFLVPPHQFSRLSLYICDGDNVSRDPRIGHVTFTRDNLSLMHEFPTEQWYPLYPIMPNSEVQGKLLVAVNITEQLDGSNTVPVLHVKTLEAAGLACWSNSGSFSDPYCTVTLLTTEGAQISDIKKGVIRRRTINPIFGDVFRFKLARYDEFKDMIVKISLWHQQLIGEDIFLGQVHLSLASLDPFLSRSYEAWYSLCPSTEAMPTKIGSVRMLVSYHEDYILPLSTYQPLLSLLTNSLTEPDFGEGALSILHEVCKDRAAMGRCIVKLFLKLNKFEELAHKLITVEVNSTSDPNTLFRGNSVASKVIDEFMKVVGQSYLHRTLQPCVDEIFEVKRSCEIDEAKLSDGENLDLNMTNLFFFVEKIMSAITSSARSCPLQMKKVFSLLREIAIKKFPAQREEVGYTAISGFIFLRFFAPAILNPKLFGLRPENPNATVSRSLLLISKTIQNLGNIGARERKSSVHKEDYMVPVLVELMDPQHIKAVKNYLDAVATEDIDDGQHSQYGPYREGYLVKRSLARKKISVKNFKKRYFVLSDTGLSYSKSRGDAIIHTIPLEDMQAVERVDETAFNMKFMLQVIQPERVLYLQTKNSVDQLEWLSALAKACYNRPSEVESSLLIHSGAYLSNSWSCCGTQTVDNPGCKPVSLAVKLLSGKEHTHLERELNKIYRLLLDSQDRLLALKDEASKSTRSNTDDTGLPPRLTTICELIVFIKNVELSSKSLLLKRPQNLGSKDSPFYCDASEAYVVK